MSKNTSRSIIKRGGNSPLFLFTAILVFFASLSSCNPKAGHASADSVALFNGYTFSLNKDESITVVDSSIVNSYTQRWNTRPIQVPLFKFIDHPNYKMYLGIPFSTSIRQAWLMQSVLNKNRIHALKSDSSTFVYSVEKHDSLYSYELFLEKEGNLFYILAEGNNKKSLDSSFSYKALRSRINKLN